MHRAPQSWVSQQVLQSAGYWLVHPFPQPPSEAAFYASVLLPAVTQVEFTSSLQLSLSRLFLQSTCLTVFRLFATQDSHAVKDFFIFDGSILGLHSAPTSTAVMRFHPGRAAITWGLAIYSWRVPLIQEAPFTMQPLCATQPLAR